MPLAHSLDADHDPVGAQHVLDGEALLQELGAPGDLDAEVGRGVLADELLDPLGGADRDGRLADDQRLAGQVRREAGDGRLDVGQVGAHAVGPLRGADADEVDVAELGGLGDVGGEAQPAGGQVAPQQLVEAGLVERHLAGRPAWRSCPRRRRSRGPRSRVRRSRWRTSRRGSRCRGRSAGGGGRPTGGDWHDRRGLGARVRDRHACLRSRWRRFRSRRDSAGRGRHRSVRRAIVRSGGDSATSLGGRPDDGLSSRSAVSDRSPQRSPE